MRYILLNEGETDIPYPNESYHFDDLITTVKQKINDTSAPCETYPNCSTCRDAGKYNHCRFNFENNIITIVCHKCKGNSLEMHRFNVYVTNPDKMLKPRDEDLVCRDVAKFVQALELPRYMIGDLSSKVSSAIGDILGSASKLRVLEMKAAELTKANMECLCKVVSTSTVLEQLHLSGCWHEDSRLDRLYPPSSKYQSLANAIGASKSLQLLRISEMDMDPEQFLVDLFASSAHKLRKFILTFTDVGSVGIQAIQQVLEHPECQLQCLDLSGLENDTSITAVANALRVNSALKELVLSCDYQILDCDILTFSQALAVNSTLEKLELRYDGSSAEDFLLSSNGWKSFVQGLREVTSLRHIDLSGSHFTIESMEILIEGLKKCDNLTHLTMQRILISSEEGFNLIGDLIKVMSLKFLDISRSNSPMSDHVLGCIAHCIESNTGLEVLKLVGVNTEGPNGLKPIISGLANNTTLQELDVSGSSDDYLLREVAEALVINLHLSKLNLKNVPLPSDDFEYFAKSLPKMKGLESILFGEIHHTLAVALLNGMKENDTLQHVDGPFGDESCWSMIDFYLRLNRGGRKMLKMAPPSVLWSRMLSRSTNDLDVLFYLLREIGLHA
ncbi:unnamed protein product [Cylindrotheca closterium]|uniref:Uncharacterized protein n=1 Tax=Cylindrotheca closterium TaxID=2856 RepID=A0AAD2G730_9STRA|nr:unnamed protein product [Cylindrotheca closterium]